MTTQHGWKTLRQEERGGGGGREEDWGRQKGDGDDRKSQFRSIPLKYCQLLTECRFRTVFRRKRPASIFDLRSCSQLKGQTGGNLPSLHATASQGPMRADTDLSCRHGPRRGVAPCLSFLVVVECAMLCPTVNIAQALGAGCSPRIHAQAGAAGLGCRPQSVIRWKPHPLRLRGGGFGLDEDGDSVMGRPSNPARPKTTGMAAFNASVLDEITWRAGEGVPFSFVAKKLQRAENCSALGDASGMDAALSEMLLCVLAGAPEDLAPLV